MMKTQFLFPNKMKSLGWVVVIPSSFFGVCYLFLGNDMFGFSNFKYFGDWFSSYIDEISLVGILSGLLLLGFSKLKIEDEYTRQIRLDSLLWATYVNVGLVILATIFLYDDAYFEAMTYNLFTLPLFFVIRFHLYLAKR